MSSSADCAVLSSSCVAFSTHAEEVVVTPFATHYARSTLLYGSVDSPFGNPVRVQESLNKNPHLEICDEGKPFTLEQVETYKVKKGVYEYITRATASCIYLYTCRIVYQDDLPVRKRDEKKGDLVRNHSFYGIYRHGGHAARFSPRITESGEAFLPDGTVIHTVTTDSYLEGQINVDTEIYRFCGNEKYELKREQGTCVVRDQSLRSRHYLYPRMPEYRIPVNVFILGDELYVYTFPKSGNETHIFHLKSMRLVYRLPYKVMDILGSESKLYVLAETQVYVYRTV